jgi:hypothetical protein
MQQLEKKFLKLEKISNPEIMNQLHNKILSDIENQKKENKQIKIQ